MKRILFLILLAFSLNAMGQFNTGSLYFTGMTGGNLGYEFTSTEFNNQNTIPYSINVEGGYFFKNRIAIGASLHTGGDHSNYFLIDTSEFTSGEHNFYLGPNIRYYKVRDDDLQLYFYGHPYFGLGTYGGTLGIAGGIGANYFLTERVAIEARASYIYHRLSSSGFIENTHSIKFEIGISLFFPSISFFDRT